METTKTIDCTLKQLPGKRRVLAGVFILTAIIIAGHIPETVFAEDAKHSSVMTALQILKGSWVRPDGGYVLEVKNIDKNGSVSAFYFNPQSIKVFRAEAAKKKSVIHLAVELRDINYPGSKYSLQYDPGTDVLKGTYYQAVTKQTFDIVFIRNK